MNFNILLSGDSIITSDIFNNTEAEKLRNIISNCDFSMTNLEVLPIDFNGNHSARSDGAHFGASSSVLENLQQMGFNLFSCANNHMLDYGEKGLSNLIEILQEKNISYSGIGSNLGQARKPVYLEKNRKVASMISCTSTFFPETRAGKSNDFTAGRYGINPLGFEVEYHLEEENFNNINRIFKSLKLDIQKEEYENLGFVPRNKPNEDTLLFNDFNHRAGNGINSTFKKSEENKIVTKYKESDANEIISWIKETKERSDVSIVSLHAHENDVERTLPSKYIKDFAYDAIDSGANIVVCHGPHLLRGIEIYQNKPIFYSLGNFIGQNDQVEVLPIGSYERFGIDPDTLPSEVFNQRSDFGKKGFPGSDDYWETVLPVCEFNSENEITSIKIYPIKLINGDKAYKRGKPYLAENEEASEILSNISALSENYGTDIVIKDDVGEIKIR